MAQTGRHRFVIDKRTTPIYSPGSEPKTGEENQETLRRYGRYSRHSRWAHEPWPSHTWDKRG